MTTLILSHDDCLVHNPGRGIAEKPRRIKAVLDAIADLRGIERLPAPLAGVDQITRVHDPGFWNSLVEAEPARGRVAVDWDTFLSRGSINAALRGSGAACFAIDRIMAGKAQNAFCAVRPPGHHSYGAVAMGFCLSNHVAVAARHAQQVHGVQRIAVVDFDVHHGNGTQAVFENSPEILFLSSHQMPLYPGTGSAEETGAGNIVNMPLKPGSGGEDFRTTWSTTGFSRLFSFGPDLLLISAGFDAHERDPLAQLELQAEDFGWITRELRAFADAVCDGRLVSVLEGGYDPKGLAESARAHVSALIH